VINKDSKLYKDCENWINKGEKAVSDISFIWKLDVNANGLTSTKPELISGVSGLLQGANKKNMTQPSVFSSVSKRKLFEKFRNVYNHINVKVDNKENKAESTIQGKIFKLVEELKAFEAKLQASKNNSQSYFEYKKTSMHYYVAKRLIKMYFGTWTVSKRNCELFTL